MTVLVPRKSMMARARSASMLSSALVMALSTSAVHASKPQAGLFLAQASQVSGQSFNQHRTGGKGVTAASPTYSLSRGQPSRYDLIQDSSLARDFALRSGVTGFNAGPGAQTFAMPSTASALVPLDSAKLDSATRGSGGTSAWWFGTDARALSVSGEVQALTVYSAFLPTLNSYVGGYARITRSPTASDNGAAELFSAPAHTPQSNGNRFGAGSDSAGYSVQRSLGQGLEQGEKHRYSLGLSGGYAHRFGRSTTFGAFASAGLDAGESYNRKSLDDGSSSVTASAGVRATLEQDTTWGSVTPELRFSYIRDLSGEHRTGGTPFYSRRNSTAGRSDFSLLPEGAEERWMLGIGTALDTEDGLRLYMDYQSGIRLGVPRFDGVVRAGVRADF